MNGQADAASPRPSRLLYVAYASPVPTRLGPARRHYHLVDQLARFYDLDFLCIGDGSEAAAFEQRFGDRVAGFTYVPRSAGRRQRHVRKVARTVLGRCDFLPALDPRLRHACHRLTSERRFDAIVLSSVLLRSLPLPADVAIVGDTHNVEFDVLRRTASHADRLLMRHYARRQWPATRREERRCGTAVDLLLATSARDRDVFEGELGLRDVAVVPNGIDLAEFVPAGGEAEPDTILFSGLMSYYPNQQAIRWFLEEVFPAIRRRRPAARLVVAGAAPPRWLSALAGPHVEVTGLVPDMRPYVRRAAVVVAPLLIGGGTRVKILEALAMERPVVSTTLGAEGLDLTHRGSVIFADDAAAFADAVVTVLAEPALAAGLGASGRRHVETRFDWDRIGDEACRLLAARLGLTGRSASLADTAARASAAPRAAASTGCAAS